MTAEGDQPEDIAGLFRKFGGDPMAYKEFAPRDEPGASTGAWPLVTPAQNAVTARPAPAVASTAPAARPPEAVSALFAAPTPVRVPAANPAPLHAVAPGEASAEPRELDALFARLLGTPQSAAPTGHGLLARWRSPN